MKGIVVSSDSNYATQYKALKDAVPVFCAEKGYIGVGGIVHDMEDWDENNFYPAAPDDAERRTFSTPYQTVICNKSIVSIVKVRVQVMTNRKPATDSNGAPLMIGKQVQDQDADGNPLTDANGAAVMIDETKEVVKQVPVYGKKWVITDEIEQKIVMGTYERKVRELEKKWNRCQEDKKLVMDMLWGQLDDDTQAQMELSLIHI